LLDPAREVLLAGERSKSAQGERSPESVKENKMKKLKRVKELKQFGLYKKVARRWVREFPEKYFTVKEKAEKVFGLVMPLYTKLDGLARAVRQVK